MRAKGKAMQRVEYWLDGAGRLFNPSPRISVVPITRDHVCVVVDDALSHPEGLIDWAALRAFGPPRTYPYPGLVLEAPEFITQRVGDYFAQHARSRLGARRTQSLTVRLSMVTVPPAELAPIQWQCHRDRLPIEPEKVLFAAMVLYLFRNPALGGTSFYQTRLPEPELDRMITDSEALGAAGFAARYGLSAGYMIDSNAYFERITSVPATWNRMIFYEGGLFHSGDIANPALLSEDPRTGRLTLNGFFTCSRHAR
jgi:Family of unknown function (DUF6445)